MVKASTAPARRGGSGKAAAARLLAAAVGGYAVSTATAVWVGGLAADAQAEAVTTGILIGFAVFPAAAVWAFAARTPLLAWVGLLGTAGTLAALTFLGGVPQ